MVNENKQDDVVQATDIETGAPAVDAGLSGRGASRRRFARAGAGATGVLLTLASHPGMACTVTTGPSGFQSYLDAKKNGQTLSSKPLSSSGKSPDQWKNGAGWPCRLDATFSKYYTCDSSNTKLKGCTIASLLKGTSGLESEKAEIAKYLVAAAMNVASGRTTFLTQANLNGIWAGYQARRSYTARPGTDAWDPLLIKNYLLWTMD